MALINVSDLSFAYDGSYDPVFDHDSFSIDSSWKLGLIGRNGKGKTTLLNLLMGKYSYQGSITSSVRFDYFPYDVNENDLERNAEELISKWKPEVELWQVLVQLSVIGMDEECLYRPFGTLSFGERTRVMLAVLFADENELLLIDEPTNHLDIAARESIKKFLKRKKGFILVSHDRDLLDAVTDHVLVLNRATIEVQAGNFSSWQDNKEKNDAFAQAENEKHMKEIKKLKASADRSSRWAAKSENSKISFDPEKEHDRQINARSYIGNKTKKMQSRACAVEKRIAREMKEKEGLLKDVEQVRELKIEPLRYHKDVLVSASDLSLSYDGVKPLFEDLRFEIRRGDRLFLSGPNGCGKSSIIKAVLETAGVRLPDNDQVLLENACLQLKNKNHTVFNISGTLIVGSGITISYVSQDTSWLSGSLKDFAKERNLNESMFFSLVWLMGLEQEQFDKDINDLSEGQKEKVLIAASLLTKAHLYIWDEPLNYIDIFSRIQIEKLLMKYRPTMLLVEHDVRFQENVATEVLQIPVKNKRDIKNQ